MADHDKNEEEEEVVASNPEATPSRILVRGLAVILPTIFTIVVLIWVLNFLNKYIIVPATWTVKYSMSHLVDNSVASTSLLRLEANPPLDYCESSYLVTKTLRQRYNKFVEGQQKVAFKTPDDANSANDTYSIRAQRRIAWLQTEAEKTDSGVYVQLGPRSLPYPVYAEVARHLPPGQIPTSTRAVYMEYVANKYFRSLFHLSLLTVVLIIFLLYFAGQFVSARLGGWFVRMTEEHILCRLPLVRNIYGSAKQVTDFFFTENQTVDYSRVAAVQYPRKGIWSIGFVTGESMMQISIGAGEPCVTFLVPSSPAPMTGYTINVPRSEVLDLNLSVEQAMQFCISCGVLSPPHQKMTPKKYKELVEQGLIRASLTPRQLMPGPFLGPGQTFIVPTGRNDDDGEDD